MHIIYVLLLLFTFPSFAVDSNTITQNPSFQTTDQILAMAHDEYSTPCASEKFSKALYEHVNEIDESMDETRVRLWARDTMMSPDVLKAVLKCREIASIKDDTKTIHFTPIIFKFPNSDRNLTINYSTQKRVLNQKILLSSKKSLPNGDPNPKLMDENDPAIYINTDPAWYAIMVVQHDSLSDFVGPDKNNTLSIKWLNDNIDSVYPHGYYCTSKSAWANDDDTINQVVHKIVDLENDSNDYYVAGDVSLEWVMYAEIALEVAITVATVGSGEGAMIGLKSARAFRTGKNLLKSMNNLLKIEDVKKYAELLKAISQHTDDIAKLEKNIANAEKYEQALKKAEQLRKAGKDATKYEKEAQEILEAAKKVDPKITENVSKMTHAQEKALADIDTNIARYEKQIEQLNGKHPSEAKKLRAKISDQKYKRNRILNQVNANKTSEATDFNPAKLREKQKQLQESIKKAENDADDLLKNSKNRDDIKKFKEHTETFAEIQKYYKQLRAFKRPQTGNVITRTMKKIKAFGTSVKAANTGAKMMGKAGRMARAGMSSRSAKIGDWLFDTTLKHGARLGRFERNVSGIYGVVSFLGDMYDQTSDSTDDFTNGIEFKPLCLLSADDLEGQENVVNYGMWFLWEGNSTDPADDDAAYLQAMDFASKFFYQLDEFQDEILEKAKSDAMKEWAQAIGMLCNVDIYVVRPIIRIDESDPNKTKGELFYLFMNDIPWSTAEQFNENVPDIEDWERVQQQMESEDPRGKYKTPEENEDDDTEDNNIEMDTDEQSEIE